MQDSESCDPGSNPGRAITKMPQIIDAKTLESLLKPEGYEYVHVTELIPGDKVRWFDQDAIIIEVNLKSNLYFIKVIDPHDQKEKEFKYKKTDELLRAPRSKIPTRYLN